MAKKNEAKINLKVDDNGSLKETGKKAKQSGKDLEKGAKGAHSYDRRLRGAAKMSSGASKNFSKMSQGISGGLVPAYATLAASLFALDAAFRFLKEAGDLRIMQEGQLAYAQVTGIAFSTLTRDLREATEGQISYKEAASAVAIGTAAGLSAATLKTLGETAKNVSLILGRDVVDSFNRLIRGVTKAEPELLDELGIILRLDKALTTYANSLGVSKESLNAFQRTQAVANEVLDQAANKFKTLEELDVSEFNKLGVAFTDLIDKLQIFIANYAEPLAAFLSKNIMAATGALLLFGTSIAKAILPNLTDWKNRQVDAHKSAKDELKKLTNQLKKYNRELGRTKGQAMTSTRALGKLNLPGAAGAAASKGDIPSKRATQAALRSMEKKQGNFYKNVRRSERSAVKKHLQTILAHHNKHQIKLKGGITKTEGFRKRSFKRIEIAWKFMHARMAGIAKGFATVMAGIMTAMGWISIIIMAAGAVKSFIDAAKSEELKLFEEGLDKASTRAADLAKNLGLMNKELRDNQELTKDVGLTLAYLGKMIGNLDVKGDLGILTDIGEQSKAGTTGSTLQRRHGEGGSLQRGADTRFKVDEGGIFGFNILRQLNASALTIQKMGENYKSIYDSIKGQGMLPKEAEDDLLRFTQILAQISDPLSTLSVADQQGLLAEAMGLIKPGGNVDTFQKEMVGAAGALDSFGKSMESYSKIRAKVQMGIIGTLFKGDELGLLKTTFREIGKIIDKLPGDTEQQQRDTSLWIGEGKDRILSEVGRMAKTIFGQQGVEDLKTYGAFIDAVGGSISDLKDIHEIQITNKIKEKDIDIALVKLGNDKSKLGAKSKVLLNIDKTQIALGNKILRQTEERIVLKTMEGNLEDASKPTEAVIRQREVVKLAEREVELLKQKKQILKDSIAPMRMMAESMKVAFETGMQTAIMGVIDGTKSMKEGFLDMAKAVLTAIAQIIAQLIAMKILQAATAFFGGGAANADGGVIPKAAGGYIGTGRKPRGYRTGGIVTEPTYLVGEGKYNEAVVPLPDGKSIPVVMKGGSSNVVVNVNVASDGQATSNLTSNGAHEAARLGRAISVAVTEELYKQKRPGGALSPYGGG